MSIPSAAIVDSVSAERIEADIRRLAGFGTRHGIGAARRWIKEFNRIAEACGGCLEVSYQTSIVTGARRMPDSTAVVNVLAIQRRTTDPNRYVIMTGDIDSRASDGSDPVTDAPGANDNASGMAGALETARALSKYEFPATIVYAGLSGEEQGLFGGQKMATEALAAGWRIEALLNNDMIGNIQGQRAAVAVERVHAGHRARTRDIVIIRPGGLDEPDRRDE